MLHEVFTIETRLNVYQCSQAPLVQLDRMSAYGADGRRFESCRGCFGSRSEIIQFGFRIGALCNGEVYFTDSTSLHHL